MKKKKLLILIAALVLVIFLSVLAIYFVSTNTHFLNFNIPKSAIDENNQNTETEPTDLTTLVEKTLQVSDKYKNGIFETERKLNLPKGFEISLYVSGLGGLRHFVFDENDNIFATDIKAGKIFLFKDNDKDAAADESIEIDKNLKSPHGIDLFEGDIYVAEQTKVNVYRDIKLDGTYSSKETLINNLPSGGHATRTIKIGPDKKIYLSIGSSCNLCEESDKRRAAIVRYSLDGKQEKIFAKGLRNTVGFTFKETDAGFEIWGVDNGRDLIGDDLPPEEVNIIEEDKHYGWPYCYGDGIANPEYPGESNFCKGESYYPAYNMQAHSAPLGIAFYPKTSSFPTALSTNIFIAFHGSWNRTIPTGYKVVRIDTSSSEDKVIDFVTGFLDSSGEIWGRPVGVGFDSEGNMFVSDDVAGALYKITYTKP